MTEARKAALEQFAPDDYVTLFEVSGRDVRGRFARLGGVLDDVLGRHSYPKPVATLLAEALTLVAMLGETLKFEGILTLQAKGDGAVKTLVADYRAEGVEGLGEVRGWCAYEADEISALQDDLSQERLMAQLLGTGYLAFTIDQGVDMQRYQGIVELEGESLAACARKYFADSEQLPTAVHLSVSHSEEGWRSGGIMIQHMPESGPPSLEDPGEDWRHTAILLGSLQDEELLSRGLSAEEVLFRLFHQDGVRVGQPVRIERYCKCSRERLAGVLRRFPADEIQQMAEDGVIRATCEFCSETFCFRPEELLQG